MTYNKPEVVTFHSALKTIQSQEGLGKPNVIAVDAKNPQLAPSNGAYEADE